MCLCVVLFPARMLLLAICFLNLCNLCNLGMTQVATAPGSDIEFRGSPRCYSNLRTGHKRMRALIRVRKPQKRAFRPVRTDELQTDR